MLNNILKVYGEDLASGALNQAAIAAGDAVAAGSTQGALCVNAFAVGDVATAAAVTITVKHSELCRRRTDGNGNAPGRREGLCYRGGGFGNKQQWQYPRDARLSGALIRT